MGQVQNFPQIGFGGFVDGWSQRVRQSLVRWCGGKAFFNAWRPRKVGIYGAGLTGKTTLDRYMTTPGEMEEIPEDERTTHFKMIGRYVLPKPTRKRISWKGEKRVVFSSDIGGQAILESMD